MEKEIVPLTISPSDPLGKYLLPILTILGFFGLEVLLLEGVVLL